MPPKKLVTANLPRSGTASFKKITEILKAGTWEFPDKGKYNGSAPRQFAGVPTVKNIVKSLTIRKEGKR